MTSPHQMAYLWPPLHRRIVITPHTLAAFSAPQTQRRNCAATPPVARPCYLTRHRRVLHATPCIMHLLQCCTQEVFHFTRTQRISISSFSLNVLVLNATMSASPSRQADPVDEAPKTCALALPPHAARAAPPAWMCRALLLNVAVPHSLVAVRRQHITRPRPHCIAARGGSPRVAQ